MLSIAIAIDIAIASIISILVRQQKVHLEQRRQDRQAVTSLAIPYTAYYSQGNELFLDSSSSNY